MIDYINDFFCNDPEMRNEAIVEGLKMSIGLVLLINFISWVTV